MADVLIYVAVLTPIITGLVEVVKKTINVKDNYVALISLIVGVAVGFAGEPFTDLELVNRLWAGGLAGLSAVGLFEAVKQRPGTTKGE